MKEVLTLERICPVRPVAPYIGGKRVLAKTIAERIAGMEHSLYVEPFIGMGGVFFRRDRRAKVEVINDISSDVANLFRILQRHYQQFLDVLKWQIASRVEFERMIRQAPDTLTDLERAARFLYLQRMGFGGKVMGRSFGVNATGGARFDLTKLVPMLEDVHERLAGVTIERLSFDQLIPRYDRVFALFYIDPPYWGCTDDYGKDVFSEADFMLLRDLLRGLQGRFILSLNDVPAVRDIFGEFALEPVELTYRVSGAATSARELLISG